MKNINVHDEDVLVEDGVVQMTPEGKRVVTAGGDELCSVEQSKALPKHAKDGDPIMIRCNSEGEIILSRAGLPTFHMEPKIQEGLDKDLPVPPKHPFINHLISLISGKERAVIQDYIDKYQSQPGKTVVF